MELENRYPGDSVAPWPGFEPGSGGRQPPILDRTILPGLPRAKAFGRSRKRDEYKSFTLRESLRAQVSPKSKRKIRGGIVFLRAESLVKTAHEAGLCRKYREVGLLRGEINVKGMNRQDHEKP